MRISEAEQQIRPISEQAEKDNDSFLACYFSRTEDKYQGWTNMDAGDALLVITHLIRLFSLSAEVIAGGQL